MQQFDYVIVGAGSAGCVLANRLTEDPAVSVLLIEAGRRATGLFKDMPISFPRYVRRRDLNWNFLSEPEPFAMQRVIEVPRGKALGGSSIINGMVYARGHRLDYDDWARAGLSGWDYAHVLPYFRRLENHWLGNGPYHGTDGPLNVCVPRENLMYEELRTASAAAGYPLTDDYHGEHDEGAQRSEMTVDHGRRASTARAYLFPALARPNLHVLSGQHVSRILFDGRRAAGVEYFQSREPETVRAAREVILAAGTYGSPQILMLSGIGPAHELEAHGIPVRADSAGVGANLVEHPFLYMGWRARPGSFRCALRADRAAISVLRWALSGTGTFSTNGAAGHVFIRTAEGLDRPDMQLTCVSVQMSAGDVWIPLFGKKPEHTLVVGVSMIRQDSRGSVRLRSADPAASPRIRFNLFEQPSDTARMIRGIRAARSIYSQAPLKQYIETEVMPGPGLGTDAELEEFVRANGAITQHPVGTCRMGTDAGAVVDGALSVNGVEGLRVIDASIMPNVPGGNTNAPTIMIAEKGADLLRGRSLPPAEV